jgi:hypothetical protein
VVRRALRPIVFVLTLLGGVAAAAPQTTDPVIDLRPEEFIVHDNSVAQPVVDTIRARKGYFRS